MYSYEENEKIVNKAVRKCLNESFYNDDDESIERTGKDSFIGYGVKKPEPFGSGWNLLQYL